VFSGRTFSSTVSGAFMTDTEENKGLMGMHVRSQKLRGQNLGEGDPKRELRKRKKNNIFSETAGTQKSLCGRGYRERISLNANIIQTEEVSLTSVEC